MRTLKVRLQKKIEPCYVIQGEDVLLYSRALELIKAAANLQLEDFNFLVFDEDSFDEERMLNSLETLPMGSDKKIVLLKNIQKFGENFKKKLQNYLKSPVESTILVIFDFFEKFNFLIAEKVSAKRMDERALKNIITAQVERAGKTITPQAVDRLIESTCSYYSLISNELEKLLAYPSEEITQPLVESLVCKETEFTVFELTDALSKRDATRAVELINLMDKDTKTFTLILNHFRRLFFASISDLTDKQLADHLGVKEYAISKARAASKNFSKLQLKNIYEMLDEVDFYIKNGQMQVENALYYIVFGILYA